MQHRFLNGIDMKPVAKLVMVTGHAMVINLQLNRLKDNGNKKFYCFI
jgi:hypothetical protein